MSQNTDQQSLELHRNNRGKIETSLKVPLEGPEDLSKAYTPGVAAACRAIHEDGKQANELTVTGNALAVVTDGSAVLGLGDIGPAAAMPVMEGKAALFKKLADIDAWPVCLHVNEPEDIIATVRALAPGFCAINLEDIAAPDCFEIEDSLQDLGIPVMHDDQHGTSITTLAGLINAVRVTGKNFGELRVVISGAGAAGRAIVQLLEHIDELEGIDKGLGEVVVCDSEGALHPGREDLDSSKRLIAEHSNPEKKSGSLSEMIRDADVFIGVSTGGVLEAEDIRSMAEDPIIFALANPDPEIHPDAAQEGGAAVVATGRSDFPNQINNLLAFPGVFRGAIDARASRISERMKLAAASAIADCIEKPDHGHLLPDPLDREVVHRVAEAVAKAAS